MVIPRKVLDAVSLQAACVLFAMTGVVLLGVFGVGHGGPSSTNIDMKFLYIAGLFWKQNLSAYDRSGITVEPELVEIMNRYDFAYPPHIAPFCILLAGLSLAHAKLLMTLINLIAAMALGFLCGRFAAERENRPLSSGIGKNELNGFVAALIMGNLTTAYVVWAGQTTLVVSVALLAGWYFCQRNRPIVAGILMAIATIKPHLTIAVVVWLMLERRWQTIATIAIAVLVLAIIPILNSGPLDLVAEWWQAIKQYPQASYNSVGSRMVFSVQSMLRGVGLPGVNLAPFAIVAVGILWLMRAKLLHRDILGLLIGLSLLFGYSHGYDLVLLAPLVYSFWRHLSGRPAAALIAFGLFLIITSPNSYFEHVDVPLLLHARVLALSVCVLWLCVLSVRGTMAPNGDMEKVGA